MTCIEIEDYYGNTIGAFITDKDIEIVNIKGFDVADKDYDYIFDTTDELIRLQINYKIDE